MAGRIAKLPLAASLVALLGLVDAIYLTIHHYNAEPVPCGAGFDCETVLASAWADIGGVPLAAFGAAAYFVAFSLALLAAFGDGRMWKLFGVLAGLMAAFSGWLIFLQAFRIGAFCQYCLVSACTSITLFLLFLVSWIAGRRGTQST